MVLIKIWSDLLYFLSSSSSVGVLSAYTKLEIKSFGEKTLIITIKALVSLLTFSSPEVLVTSKQSSKLVTTILAINLVPQTIFAGLVIKKVIHCCK